MISFASFSPHPPLLLPEIGSKQDRLKVKKTIESLEILAKKLKKEKPDKIIISSPHPDWGFEVPLYFLAKNFRGGIEKVLIGSESPRFYFDKGTKFSISNFKFSNKSQIPNPKIAVIASGDLSHCLKKEGPYGFRADGPKFDAALVKYLKEKNITGILNLNEAFPEAGECGLRSFCFILGILEAQYANTGVMWQPQILSYEAPFGVGYLAVYFHINNKRK